MKFKWYGTVRGSRVQVHKQIKSQIEYLLESSIQKHLVAVHLVRGGSVAQHMHALNCYTFAPNFIKQKRFNASVHAGIKIAILSTKGSKINVEKICLSSPLTNLIVE